jgi:hypothetical protein
MGIIFRVKVCAWLVEKPLWFISHRCTKPRILTAQDGGTDIAITYSGIIDERRLPMAQE